MKVVPKREHMVLEKKYEALKEKVATQDETIRYLRSLLSEKNIPYTDAVQNFTEMMEKQAQQFHARVACATNNTHLDHLTSYS